MKVFSHEIDRADRAGLERQAFLFDDNVTKFAPDKARNVTKFAPNKARNVTKAAPNKAPKIILGDALTFDERVTHAQTHPHTHTLTHRSVSV